jgi:hypothetical protein
MSKGNQGMPSKQGHFMKGGKPGPGRTPGLRPRFANTFLRALQDDFDKHGVAAIESVRVSNPVDYLKICASIVPKAMVIQAEVTDARKSVTEYSTSELVALLTSGGSEEGAGETIDGESIPVGVH